MPPACKQPPDARSLAAAHLHPRATLPPYAKDPPAPPTCQPAHRAHCALLLAADDAGVLLTTYRVGSVGQDSGLALWDLTLEEDPSYVNAMTGQTGMK